MGTLRAVNVDMVLERRGTQKPRSNIIESAVRVRVRGWVPDPAAKAQLRSPRLGRSERLTSQDQCVDTGDVKLREPLEDALAKSLAAVDQDGPAGVCAVRCVRQKPLSSRGLAERLTCVAGRQDRTHFAASFSERGV